MAKSSLRALKIFGIVAGSIVSGGAAWATIAHFNPFAMQADLIIVADQSYDNSIRLTIDEKYRALARQDACMEASCPIATKLEIKKQLEKIEEELKRLRKEQARMSQ